MSNFTAGLYVVATPIGNLDDLTVRARQVLQAADVVAAENPTHTRALLAQYGIKATLTPLHQHNEEQQSAPLLARVAAGEIVALVSDAGTPLMCDPGYRLVRAAKEAGLPVIPVPGACAAIAALSVAGLASDRFAFEGFLPAKSKARRERLASLASESRTLIFYESTHRIVESLEDMAAAFGPSRRACVARELTKLFETVSTAPLEALVALTRADANAQRGEFVVLVEGAADDDGSAAQLREGLRVQALLKAHLPPSAAAKLAAEITGAPRKALYGNGDGGN